MNLYKLIFGREKNDQPEHAGSLAELNLETAVAALLIEMACSDDEFDQQEETLILEILKSKFSLGQAEAAELTQAANKAREESIDLYGFTKQINTNFSHEQKIQMIDLLWDVIYADGRLDGHEDYLIHTLTKMLNLDHADMIDAKLRASDKS